MIARDARWWARWRRVDDAAEPARRAGASMAVHLHAGTRLPAVHLQIMLASVPLAVMWVWNSGYQLRHATQGVGAVSVPDWRNLWLPGAQAADWMIGMAQFLPLLATSLACVLVLEMLFAAVRRRAVEPGWMVPAWLFTLLLPAGVGLSQAMFAMGFGLVFGKLIFGGAGKHLVSPALLGGLYLRTAHPEAFMTAPAGGVVSAELMQTAWERLADGGVAALQAAGIGWMELFVGQEASAFGATSALACLLGAAFLMWSRAVAWRILAGGMLGLVAGVWLLGMLMPASPVLTAGWHWHAVLGAFAFGLVFLAADPGCTPLTRGGRWFLGGAAGALAVAIRVLDPAHPDGVLQAILLAALFAPLADHLAVWRAARRRRRREEAWP